MWRFRLDGVKAWKPILTTCSHGQLTPGRNDLSFDWASTKQSKGTKGVRFFFWIIRQEDRLTGWTEVGEAWVSFTKSKSKYAVINVSGDTVGQLLVTVQPETNEGEGGGGGGGKEEGLVFPAHSFVHCERAFVTRDRLEMAALRTCIPQFGLEIPTWVFTCGYDLDRIQKVDRRIFERLLRHIQKWMTVSEPEQLGQLVGDLVWRSAYLRDICLEANGSVSSADHFSSLLVQPPGVLKAGDCEDQARTTASIMELLLRHCPDVHPLVKEYCPLILDTVICDPEDPSRRGLHNCTILVPFQLLYDCWLPLELRPNKRHTHDKRGLPILLLESTDRSLTEWLPEPDRLRSFIHHRLYLQGGKVPLTGMSYPFCDASYRQQKYFNRFVVAYSPTLFRLLGVPSFTIHTGEDGLGCSVEDLMDLKQRARIILAKRSAGTTNEEKALARRYFNEWSPAPLPALTLQEKEEEEEEVKVPRDVVPVYFRSAYCKDELEARRLVRSNWGPDLQVVATEVVNVCNQFDGVICVWIKLN